MKPQSFLSNILFITYVVYAQNDWRTACTEGWCSWDIDDDATLGQLVLTSSTSALSDLTPAAGWHILDCDPDSLGPQTIRLVCESADQESAGCNAIFEEQIEDTIVRLPNSCAAGPFARLVDMWDSDDQDIPESARRKFRKRQDPPGIVKNAVIDFDFASAKSGTPVTLEATGSNHPLAPVQQNPAQIRKRLYQSQKTRRGMATRGIFDDFFDFLSDLNTIDIDKEGSSDANFVSNFPVLRESITCPATGNAPPTEATISIDVDIDVQTRVNYGFVVSGTIIPPKIDDAGLYAALTGRMASNFTIRAGAKAIFDSKRVQLAAIPLSPLTIPGIVTIGPETSIGVQGIASLGMTGEMVIGASMDIPKVEMRFPARHGESTGDVSSLDTPLKLQVNPGGKMSGALEAHLIPRVSMGINLINGFAKANVFLDLDMFGRANLNFTASSLPASEEVNPDPNVALYGCAGADVGLFLRVGAEGAIAGVFEATAAYEFLRRTYELFKKCFGDVPPAKREVLTLPAYPEQELEKRQSSLECVTSYGATMTIADGVFKSSINFL